MPSQLGHCRRHLSGQILIGQQTTTSVRALSDEHLRSLRYDETENLQLWTSPTTSMRSRRLQQQQQQSVRTSVAAAQSRNLPQKVLDGNWQRGDFLLLKKPKVSPIGTETSSCFSAWPQWKKEPGRIIERCCSVLFFCLTKDRLKAGFSMEEFEPYRHLNLAIPRNASFIGTTRDTIDLKQCHFLKKVGFLVLGWKISRGIKFRTLCCCCRRLPQCRGHSRIWEKTLHLG